MTTNKKAFWLYLFLFVVILVIVFRSLIFNIGTNLYSWLDLPYVTWIVYQGISKI